MQKGGSRYWFSLRFKAWGVIDSLNQLRTTGKDEDGQRPDAVSIHPDPRYLPNHPFPRILSEKPRAPIWAKISWCGIWSLHRFKVTSRSFTVLTFQLEEHWTSDFLITSLSGFEYWGRHDSHASSYLPYFAAAALLFQLPYFTAP